MSGYRDELDSALRQLDELRAEATRLRAELDETRRASASSLAHAMVGWSHAKPRTRLAIVVGPAVVVAALGAVVLGVTALDARRPPAVLGAVEPLGRVTAAACAPCPEQRPCIERHCPEPEPPPPPPGGPVATDAEGIITEGRYRGLPYLGPTVDAPQTEYGLLMLHMRLGGTCAIGPRTFTAPATIQLRAGDYDLHCSGWDSRQRKRWRVRIAGGLITQSWNEDLSQPAKRGLPERPSEWTPLPQFRP